jgi:hypothetical protein
MPEPLPQVCDVIYGRPLGLFIPYIPIYFLKTLRLLFLKISNIHIYAIRVNYINILRASFAKHVRSQTSSIFLEYLKKIFKIEFN